MIGKILIKGLYDQYSYDIKISKKTNVFLLTGPNGFGKTTILRCIKNLLDYNFWFFYYLKFNELIFYFEDSVSIQVRKETLPKQEPLFGDFGETEDEYKVIFTLNNNEKNVSLEISREYIDYLLKSRSIRRSKAFQVEKEEEFIEKNYNIHYDAYILERARDFIRYLNRKTCVYIQEQRLFLYKDDSATNNYTIDYINSNFKKLFEKAQNEYARKCQIIDGSFVKRLAAALQKQPDETKGVDMRSRIKNKLQEKIEKYKNYGLIEDMDIVSDIDPGYNTVLDLYMKDMTDKLDSISSFYNQVEAFDKFVTGKELSYKSLKFSLDGIELLDRHKKSIKLNKLSSGEQNLIILAYELIFETPKGSILLIDEPENSLHMSWLQTLLADYIRIAKAIECQIIIATHSPALINDCWDLTFDLCENNLYETTKENQ